MRRGFGYNSTSISDPVLFFIWVGVLFFLMANNVNCNQRKSKLYLPYKQPKRQKREAEPRILSVEEIPTVELIPGKYWIYKTKANLSTAFCYCASSGRQLASLDTEKDFSSVVRELFKISKYNSGQANNEQEHELWLGRSYWVGISDKSEEGTWQLVGTNKGILSHDKFWHYGQPDHLPSHGKPGNGQPEHCVQLVNICYQKNSPEIKRVYTHRFHDWKCNSERYFICEQAEDPPILPSDFGICPTIQTEPVTVGVSSTNNPQQKFEITKPQLTDTSTEAPAGKLGRGIYMKSVQEQKEKRKKHKKKSKLFGKFRTASQEIEHLRIFLKNYRVPR